MFRQMLCSACLSPAWLLWLSWFQTHHLFCGQPVFRLAWQSTVLHGYAGAGRPPPFRTGPFCRFLCRCDALSEIQDRYPYGRGLRIGQILPLHFWTFGTRNQKLPYPPPAKSDTACSTPGALSKSRYRLPARYGQSDIPLGCFVSGGRCFVLQSKFCNSHKCS